MPGDLVFGLNKASEELEISVQSLRTILDLLKVSENLTIKTTNKFSVISIVNWNIYQSEENEINTQINTPLTNEQQTTNNKQTQETQKNENKREYTPEFLSFYEAYPKHKKRDDAFKAWNSQNGKRPSIDVILMAVEKQKKSPDWIKNNGQFIPYPASWLRAGCWADEVSFEEINKQNKREGVRI